MKRYQLINEPVRGTDPVQPSCVTVAIITGPQAMTQEFQASSKQFKSAFIESRMQQGGFSAGCVELAEWQAKD